jgi:lysozyme
MHISAEGLSLIKKFEGCPEKDGICESYKCAAGVWTIGYGSTHGVTEGMKITKNEAETLLQEEMHEYEGYINDMVKVPLEQHQFDSLVSWQFNTGGLRTSTLLKVLNKGNYDEVPNQIRRWNKATVNGVKVVLDGLVRRREAEAKMFLNQDWYEV